jgi:SAM-dependent methyltransferase
MNREQWNERYAADELIWTATPNRFLVEQVADIPVGAALDVACGEGRNAVWLATQGWKTTGLDFSAVGLKKANDLARANDVDVDFIEADVLTWKPPPRQFDLIVLAYVQLPALERCKIHQQLIEGLAFGGTLLVIAHATDNLLNGYGGPQDPQYLFSSDDVVDDLADYGMIIDLATEMNRPVETDRGSRIAIDVVVRARRPLL